ncbi:MAG: hypothetical protein MHM6MM_002929 [Cercozoa sp. M6MM]
MTKPSAPATISWLSSVLKPRVEGLKDRGERIASALGRHPFLVALAGTSAVGGSAVYSSWDAVAQWLGDRIAAHVAYCGGLYDNGKASVAFGLPKLTRRSSIFGHTESSGVSLTRLLFDVDAAGAPPVLDEALSDRVSRVLAHSDAFVGKGVIALTGPPRCGKSAFLEAFLRALRFEGRSDDVRLSIIEASSNIWELVDAKTFKRRGDTPLARVLLYLSNGKPRWYDTRRRQVCLCPFCFFSWCQSERGKRRFSWFSTTLSTTSQMRKHGSKCWVRCDVGVPRVAPTCVSSWPAGMLPKWARKMAFGPSR